MNEHEIEAEIDRLYQLPIGQFTAARNALAKRASGADSVRVASLRKPTFTAWAANQLHWRKRSAMDRLVKARDELRRAQEAVLTGRDADVRKATEEHRSAVKDGLEALRGILGPQLKGKEQAVRQILEALPAHLKPGRLAEAPEAMGFDVFAGISPQALRPHTRGARRKKAAHEPQTATTPRDSRSAAPVLAATQSTGVSPRQAGAKPAKKALAEAKRGLLAARLDQRRAQAAARRALSRLEEERSRERDARDRHESAVKRVTMAQAESARLAEAAEAAARALREAEERLAGLRESP
jgi:hypothetical protein